MVSRAPSWIFRRIDVVTVVMTEENADIGGTIVEEGTPLCGDRRVFSIEVIITTQSTSNLKTFVIRLQNIVNNACNRIRTINRRCAVS